MNVKKAKVILVLFVVLGIALNPFKIVNAHSVELDPESLISMPMMMIGGTGTITIKSSVSNYELYFQAIQVENTTFSQLEKTKNDGDTELKTLKEAYTDLKTEVDNLKETYNSAYTAYTEGSKNTTLSEEEKENLKSAYETAETNYRNKVTEYNNKIDEYNNKVKEINSKIKELTPMYTEENWTKTTDNKITIDTTQFSGEQPYTVWVKLVTSEGTYYDESIYTMTGEKATEVEAKGVSLDKTSLELTKNSSYTLTATITPSDATNKKVTWESDNEDVATVVNGKVTAKALGTAIITVTTDDGGYTATCKVSVTEKTTQSSDDSTIAQNKLPYAGISRIAIILSIILSILGIVLYKRYRYFNI